MEIKHEIDDDTCQNSSVKLEDANKHDCDMNQRRETEENQDGLGSVFNNIFTEGEGGIKNLIAIHGKTTQW